MSSNEEDAIKNIQAAVRGYITRKQYGVQQLGDNELMSYVPFLIGNDIPLSQKELQPYQISQPFVLVGTSMFRCIDFACKLTGDKFIPKVIIVDNSAEVFHCWLELKRFFTETQLTDKDDYLEGEEGLLEFIIKYIPESTRGENAYTYFKQFFKTFSFEYVKKVVMATAVVKQDWADIDTFNKIKNIYSGMPIVAYPSNIISCINDSKEQLGVLQCMELLDPVLCIYSNLDSQLRRPTKTHVLVGFNPKIIAETLNLSEEVKKECESSKLTKNV